MEYAFISHESAVAANRAIARMQDFTPLDDEGIWQIADRESCVTTQRAFKRLAGDLRLEDYGITGRPVHLLVPTASSRSRGRDAEFHVWSDFFPNHAFVRVHERLFISSPLFAAVQLALSPRPTRLKRAQVARYLEAERSIRSDLGIEEMPIDERDLLRWEGIARQVEAIRMLTEFSGTYRMPSRPEEQTLYGMPPALERSSLVSFLESQPAIRGGMKGRSVAALAFDGSASPMETALALLLTLPVAMGGFGIGRPELNKPILPGIQNRALSSQEEMVADLCWPDKQLIIEYDSHEWHGSAGPRHLAHDRSRANSLTALGWRMLTVGYEQISTVQGAGLLARQVAALLGSELEEPDDLRRIWRSRLHALLMPASRGLG